MIEYRKATLDDLDDLLKIRMDFLDDVTCLSEYGDKKTLFDTNREYLLKTLSEGSYIQWLGIDGGRIVGTSSISMLLLPPHSRRINAKVAYLGNIFTYPEYRKQGIASKLFSLALESAKESDCREIILDASESGRPLYEKYGFKKNEEAMIYHIKDSSYSDPS